MKQDRSSLAAATIQCLGISLAAGLLVSLILIGLVLLLGSSSLAAAEATDPVIAGTTVKPETVRGGFPPIYGEKGFTSAPMLHRDVHIDVLPGYPAHPAPH